MATILFIDDEPYYARNYVEQLEEHGHTVVVAERADDGLRRYCENPAGFQVLVLDFMMPTPAGISVTETDDGLATGRWFLRKVRDLLEKNSTRVIVLTNRGPEAIRHIIEQDVLLKMDYAKVCQKIQTPAFYLPTVVKILLG